MENTDDGGNSIAASKSKKKLLLRTLVSIFVVTAIVTVLAAASIITNSNNKHHPNPTHGIIKSSCGSTLYPDLCITSVLLSTGVTSSKVKSVKDVIKMTLNLTTVAAKHNYLQIKKITMARQILPLRVQTAIHDCLEMVDYTLDLLHKVELDLQDYPSKKKLIKQQADDLKIRLSAVMTYQETCLDGFSHDKADKKFREVLKEGQIHVLKMCSNALAMVKNLTDTDMAKEQQHSSSTKRKLRDEEIEWPEWLSAGDRRLLQARSVTPNVVVAADGSGDYKTVSAAVAAPPNGSTRYIIKIKAGAYRENVDVPKKKINLMFVGDGQSKTIITARRNVFDNCTTFNSSTVAINGEGFLARDITFENTAGAAKQQAVALRVSADKSAFYKCGMIAFQDTLYVHTHRQFYTGCYIAGTVDFIFGNAAVVFQNCDIHARKPDEKQKNMVTAQGRDDPNQNTGIVIQKCSIGATKDLLAELSNFPTYLGRPWKNMSRTVVMQTEISDVIDPAGWYEWNGTFALDTLYYAEYENTGPGADTSKRVKWKGFKVITNVNEAQSFSAGNFIDGGSWLDSTRFPYSLGL